MRTDGWELGIQEKSIPDPIGIIITAIARVFRKFGILDILRDRRRSIFLLGRVCNRALRRSYGLIIDLRYLHMLPIYISY